MRIVLSVLVLCALVVGQDATTRPKRPGLSLPPARPGAGHINLRTERWIAMDGAVRTEVRATWSIFEYPAYKKALGDPQEVLRRILPASPIALEKEPPRAEFDDDTGTLILERTEIGDVRADAEGGRSYRVEDGPDFVEIRGAAGRPSVVFKEAGALFGMPYEGKQTVFVPQLSSSTTFDPVTRLVRWTPARLATKPAPARLSLKILPAERVLTGAYKAYGFEGPHFVGRVVISNAGPGRPTKLRVRHRVEGYSEWSPWLKFADLASGETIVAPLHPVFSAATAQLRSDTPANLMVEWTYVDGDGAERADSDGEKLVLLGGNEFIFCRSTTGLTTFADQYDNAALLAAWVSRDDAIIREVAALGAKRAGGAAANEGNYAAIATLKGLYELMVANDITYQHPPALADTTLSFDNGNVQNVKYPRDVLRDRSGTCIDLAVLYASMLHATGLPAYLCIIPGHCFPVVGLPDGGLAAVEVTGVGGGGRMGADAATFGDVFLYGMKELEKALMGPHVLVDLRHQWTHGVSCPELPAVGPEYTSKKPLREKIDPEKQATLSAIREQAIKDLVGVHDIALKDAAGNMSNAVLKIAVAVDAKTFLLEMKTSGSLPVGDGNSVEVELVQVFEGRSLLSALKCRGLRKSAKVKATGEQLVLAPDFMEIERWGDGFLGYVLLAGSEAKPEKLEIVAPKN